ncbi:MAG: peroxidase family protein [Desulfobacterales bacterium]
MNDESKCPVTGKKGNPVAGGGTSNRDWWPNQLNLRILHQQDKKSNPMGESFNYAEEFKTLDLAAVKKDLFALMTDSQNWWPADYGHYGPLFIRMAWHSAGTYRMGDGRGGAGSGSQRLSPLNSWPDNVNLDKARRLLWPIKQKYGRKISWADLMILPAIAPLSPWASPPSCLLAGGWTSGNPKKTFTGAARTNGSPPVKIQKPLLRRTGSGKSLAAVQMGLIYVTRKVRTATPIRWPPVMDVRETFARMAMNDEETVALVAGGIPLANATARVMRPMWTGTRRLPLESQGLGWKSSFGSWQGRGYHQQRYRGRVWKPYPTRWDMGYLKVLFKYDYELVKSLAG